MAKKIYVGNLPWNKQDGTPFRNAELNDLFAQYGEVELAEVAMDNNRSKGFGFVTMVDEAASDAAIAALNGTELEGRMLKVEYAQPKRTDGFRDNRDNRGGRY